MDKDIFLDHNSTTRISPEALSAMFDVAKMPLNPSSVHSFGRYSRKILEEARANIASSLNINLISDEYDIVFTSSGTESNNLAIKSFFDRDLYVSAIEHPSILKVASKNKQTKLIKVDKNGLIDQENFSQIISDKDKPKFFSVMLANNETGVIQDISSLIKMSRTANSFFHCDAVQAYGKINIDLKELDCDLLTLSAHKCGGPVGCGVLVFKKKLHLTAMIEGGGQEKSLRSGTENVMAIVGFSKVVEKIKSRISKFEEIKKLRDFLEGELVKITNDVKFYGQEANRLPNTSLIKMPNISNELQLIKFDLEGIGISAGSACSSGKVDSSHVLKAMGIEEEEGKCTIRVSLGEDTTHHEIVRFIDVWKKIYSINKKNGKK